MVPILQPTPLDVFSKNQRKIDTRIYYYCYDYDLWFLGVKAASSSSPSNVSRLKTQWKDFSAHFSRARENVLPRGKSLANPFHLRIGLSPTATDWWWWLRYRWPTKLVTNPIPSAKSTKRSHNVLLAAHLGSRFIRENVFDRKTLLILNWIRLNPGWEGGLQGVGSVADSALMWGLNWKFSVW